MSAIRNYRRSLSERRASLSEMYQQDAKRLSENSNAGCQASSKVDGRRGDSSSDDDDDDHQHRQGQEVKQTKERQRRFSLDFLFSRKNKGDAKKNARSQSTSTQPGEQGYSKYPAAQGV